MNISKTVAKKLRINMHDEQEMTEFAQRCIDSAEGKLASARILRKNKHFENSIFLYIIAYEEAGKADFIMTKVSFNEKITSKDLEKLSDPSSHNRKILEYHLNRKKTFSRFQNSNIKKLNNIILTNSDIFETKQMQKRYDGSLKILSKLDNLKKRLFYSDFITYNDKKKKFSKKDLDSVCHLLDFQSEISIALSSLRLEASKITPSGNKEKHSKKISQLPSMKKFEMLKKLEQSSKHKMKIESAVSVILSF